MPHALLLRIAALVAFVVAAIVSFGAFGSSVDVGDMLGIISIGLATLTASFLP